MRAKERKPDKYWAYRFIFTHSDHELFSEALPRGYFYYWAAEDILRRHFGSSDPDAVRDRLWKLKKEKGKDFSALLNEALRQEINTRARTRDDSDRS